MKKIWIKKFSSFKEAEDFDDEYYCKETPQQRLNDIQLCREIYFKLKNININESRKRLRRVFRIVQ